ncbi:acyl carrier protein [Micromonospora sp. b486]|uniref:acyl carrier protein n=1 Tax=Micromonospora sp. b486 TaxID=3053986 RepID=UPI00259CC5CA|nr:acyl carrier protein [Micromonospora sp. b486]MDM4777778.1 acyl carrier protein [Micromonospora sp. b486]
MPPWTPWPDCTASCSTSGCWPAPATCTSAGSPRSRRRPPPRWPGRARAGSNSPPAATWRCGGPRGRPAAPELADALGTLIDDHLAALESIAGPAAGTGDDAAPAAPERAGDDGVRAAVLGALGDTLDLDSSALRTTDVLRELPGFDSFRLVDVIDRVERRLGVEVPATALSAADLRDVGSLCAMFGAATGGAR